MSNKGNLITSIICILLGLSVISEEPIWGSILCVLAGVLLVFIPVRSYVWKKAFNNAKQYQDYIHLNVGNDGLHVEHILGKSDLNWDFYQSFLETPKSIILYMSKHSFSVIPKDPFIESDCLDNLLDLLGDKLKKI
ncbi:MAG: YcxB family protein [Clostridia bacterium]|nr:YcxB family protein [Clostridia bacterium]